ncbi:hypothetical protein B1A_08113, partial [mine drainage metagenome]
LMLGWLAVEVFCSYLGLNLTGYTQNQMQSINRYDHLLLEMGENAYKNIGNVITYKSDWSPELRIVFVSLVSAGLFALVKLLSGILGINDSSLANSITEFFTGNRNITNTQQEQEHTEGRSSQPNLGDLVGMISPFVSGFFNQQRTPAPPAQTPSSAPLNFNQRSRTPAYQD